MRELRGTVCVLACVLLLCKQSAGKPRVSVLGTSFRDESNRSLIFHGVNYVSKSAPYIPQVDAAEIQALKSIGSNAVRLGVMMTGVFPTADAIVNATYLAEIGDIVDVLWRAGISSILDLHQDVFSPKICGEGMPEWMVNVSSLHCENFPLPASRENQSKPDTVSGSFVPSPDCSARGLLKFIGWSEFYLTDASGKAFAQFYEGTSMAGKMVEKYWTTVAGYFRNRDGVLAYELLNEPWVGDHVKHPNLLLEAGVAEKESVGPYMKRVHSAVRAVDPDTMTLFSPAEVNNRFMRHVGYERGFLPGEPMAFHVYCVAGTDGAGPTTPVAKEICHFNDEFQLETRRSDLKRLGTAAIVTEFGAVNDAPTGLAEVRFVAEHFDGPGMPLSWIYWSYNRFGVPSEFNYRQQLARSYPRAVAGDIQSLFFNATDGEFVLTFVPTSAALTEVFVSEEFHYEGGFVASASPKSCCEVTLGTNLVSVSVINSRLFLEKPVRVAISRKQGMV